MNKEQQRIAIAEACGWECIYDSRKYLKGINGFPPNYAGSLNDDIARKVLPNYLSDLNDMHEAWSTLSRHQKIEATDYLIDIVKATREYLKIDAPPNLAWSQRVSSIADILDASASQYAEAFLNTLNLWTQE